MDKTTLITIRKYLAAIGAKGGKKSNRSLAAKRREYSLIRVRRVPIP